MKTFVAEKALTIPIEFTNNGQPVLINGDVEWVLTDSTGSDLLRGTVTAGPLDFRVSIEISPIGNLIYNTSFARRTLTATATVAGKIYEVQQSYRLIPSIPFTVTPAEVRGYIGVNDRELPDDDIDIVKSVLELQADLGTEVFRAALTSGERSELRANDAILYKTVLALIPSLPNRVANKETDGQLSFQRNSQKDFSALAAVTAERLGTALSLVVTRSEIAYALLITTNDADPVTG